MLGVDKYKYGKLIKEMKNDILRKKDPFLKTVAEACHVLSKWKNHYEGKYNNHKNESNDGIAFTTVTKEKETKKSNKKKDITCFRCKKIGHGSKKCEEELPRTNHEKKGANLLASYIFLCGFSCLGVPHISCPPIMLARCLVKLLGSYFFCLLGIALPL